MTKRTIIAVPINVNIDRISVATDTRVMLKLSVKRV